jgi:hypothetical protein
LAGGGLVDGLPASSGNLPAQLTGYGRVGQVPRRGLGLVDVARDQVHGSELHDDQIAAERHKLTRPAFRIHQPRLDRRIPAQELLVGDLDAAVGDVTERADGQRRVGGQGEQPGQRGRGDPLIRELLGDLLAPRRVPGLAQAIRGQDPVKTLLALRGKQARFYLQ